jgi:hypothetical protein
MKPMLGLQYVISEIEQVLYRQRDGHISHWLIPTNSFLELRDSEQFALKFQDYLFDVNFIYVLKMIV